MVNDSIAINIYSIQFDILLNQSLHDFHVFSSSSHHRDIHSILIMSLQIIFQRSFDNKQSRIVTIILVNSKLKNPVYSRSTHSNSLDLHLFYSTFRKSIRQRKIISKSLFPLLSSKHQRSISIFIFDLGISSFM